MATDKQTLEILTLVFGIIGLIGTPLGGGGLIFAILTIIFYFLIEGEKSTMAKVGFWLAIISIILSILTVLFFIIFFGGLIGIPLLAGLF